MAIPSEEKTVRMTTLSVSALSESGAIFSGEHCGITIAERKGTPSAAESVAQLPTESARVKNNQNKGKNFTKV